MKENVRSLIVFLAILFTTNLTFSQNTLKESKFQISLSDSVWIESNINMEIRNHRSLGFFDLNELPGNDNKGLVIFRTYRTSINSGFTIIELNDSIQALKTLKGKVKFSGSDIDQTQDTLIIAAYYSKTKDSLLVANLNKGLISENAVLERISEPLVQFEHFQINLSKSHEDEERKFLIIQLIIKSGSDDNFYYGISDAVIDNLYLTQH